MGVKECVLIDVQEISTFENHEMKYQHSLLSLNAMHFDAALDARPSYCSFPKKAVHSLMYSSASMKQQLAHCF